MRSLAEMFGSDSEEEFEKIDLAGVVTCDTDTTTTDSRERTELEKEKELYEKSRMKMEREEQERLRKRLEERESTMTKLAQSEEKAAKPSLEILLGAFITRNKMAQCLYYPKVEGVLKGCFARVATAGKYRIVEIVSVSKCDVYTANGLEINKLLNVSYGDAISTCRIELLSNTPPDASEFERYLKTVINSTKGARPEGVLKRKTVELNAFLTQRKTAEFLQKVLQNKKTATGRIALRERDELARLQMAKDEAERKKDTELTERLGKRIEVAEREQTKKRPAWKQERKSFKTKTIKGSELDETDPCKRKKCRTEIIFGGEKKQEKSTELLSAFIKRQE